MTPPRDDRVASLFDEACRLSADARRRFLDSVCAHDPAMRGLLESLLLATGAEAVSDHIATQPSPPSTAPHLPGLRADDPIQLGPYHLLSILGSGSFGVVYLAERRDPIRQRVALKLLMHGAHHAEIVARFQQERQHLALMDHPAIAKIFDAGAAPDGRPYFVMEYVKGDPITSYCDALHLGLRERLTLFLAVCDGVQHAHSMGVIHRDLKPSNVLVAIPPASDDLAGGTRAALGRPMIIDFGISKAIHSTAVTHATLNGETVGTPAYMSPEQAAGHAIDPRADVYALGVMLYELLAGVLPFDPTQHAGGFPAFLKHVAETDPARPSDRLSRIGPGLNFLASSRDSTPTALLRALRHDLEWIPLKAIEKDRARRYQSAGALAADIDRYLDNIPIDARPPSITYRAGKFARRNRILLIGASVVAAVLIAGSSISLYHFFETRRAEQHAAHLQAIADASDSILISLLRRSDPRTPHASIDRQSLDSRAAQLDRLHPPDRDEPPADPETEIGDRLALARQYLAINAPDPALTQADAVLKLVDNMESDHLAQPAWTRRIRSSTLGLRAIFYINANRLSEAHQQLREAVALRRSLHLPSDDILLDQQVNLAIIASKLNNDTEALDLFQRVIDASDRRNDNIIVIESTARTGRASILGSNFATQPEAINEARRAVDCALAAAAPQHLAVMDARMILGLLLRRSGDSRAAFDQLRRARESAAHAGVAPNNRKRIELSIMLAQIYADDDNLKPAEALAAEAFQQLPSADIDADTKASLYGAATEALALAIEQRSPESAIELYNDQLRTASSESRLTAALLGLARARIAAGQPDQAVEPARDAYNRRRAAHNIPHDSPLMLTAIAVYGSALSASGDLDNAEPLLNAAASADRDTLPIRLRKYIARSLAEHAARAGRTAEARLWQSKLDDLSRASPSFTAVPDSSP